MKLQSVLLGFYLLLFSVYAQATPFEIKTVRPFQKWTAHQIQETVIAVEMPKDFHAYKDQIKVLNIKPAGFKAGQIKMNPEIEFFDKFSKKNRQGIKEKGTVSILFEAPDAIPADLKKIEFDLRHQICSDQVCFLPVNIPISVDIANSVIAKEENISLFQQFENSLATNLPLSFFIVFLAGILTSFTPCIFPMLPITLSILGHHAEERTRLQNFMRSVIYVLGIATTYSVLGVIAALTGSLFGGALTNKYVVLGLSVLFITMALSMWGVFELQAPAFIRNRFGSGKSESNFEAYIMGLVAGIVASPCVGPVLISILTFVSSTRNAVLGFSLLFIFALGLGMLFIVLGIFGEALKYLPRSGPWMNFIKFLLGALMWGAALYYLRFAIPERWWIASVAVSLLALSIWKGAFRFGPRAYLRQSFMLALFIFSFTVTLLSFVRPQYLSPAFQLKATETSTIKPEWTTYSEEELAKAQAADQPVIIDFWATWCAACFEIEEKIFNTPEFVEMAKSVKLLKVDATEDNEVTQQILKKYKVQGLPTVLFINRKGDLLKHLTLTQATTWDVFKPKLIELTENTSQ